MRNFLGSAGAAVVLALVAGACARSAPSPGAASQARQLERILSGAATDAEADEFELRLAAHKSQLAADCMVREGYKYTPPNPRAVVDTTTNTDFASLPYAKEYGFGVTSTGGFRESADDPNTAYVKTLSQEAQQAYAKQLNTCQEKADAAGNRDFGTGAANSHYDSTDAKVRRDPRFVTAQADWASCARAKGYDLPTRLALIESFRARLAEVMKPIQQRAMSDGGIVDDELTRLQNADPAFRKLRQDERAAAVETFPCSQVLDHAYVQIYESLR
jgi:hypothetical protein